MAMWISCHSSLSEEKTRELIRDLHSRFPEIMQYFWVSEPGPCNQKTRAEEAKNGIDAQCSFVVERNYDEGSHFMKLMPKLLYEVFGPDVILVRGLDYLLVRPEDAEQIAAAGWPAQR